MIAVFLFIVSNTFGIIQVPLRVDIPLIKGLAPLIVLNVIGLRWVQFLLYHTTLLD